MFKKFIVISMVMLFAISQPVFASEQRDVGHLNDIARTENGVFVAVGEGGTILKSADGHKWNEVKTSQKENINAVVSNKSVFYAVGDKGIILRSMDGAKWSKVNYTVKLKVSDLVDKRYIANVRKQDRDMILTNTDMMLSDVIWTGKQYVAIGRIEKKNSLDIYHTFRIIAQSTDGVSWKIRTLNVTNFTSSKVDAKRGTADLNAIYWNGDRYVVIGDDLIFTSKDLNQWTSVSIVQGDIRDAIYHENQWIAVGWDGNLSNSKGVIYTSKDGVSWSSQEKKMFEAKPFNSIVWTGDRYLVSGKYGLIMYSKDALNWEFSPSIDQIYEKFTFNIWNFHLEKGIYTDVKRIYADKGIVLGIGYFGTILTSKDQLTWESVFPNNQ